ncbi:LOW QUALITY PROTEIN: hypothetical protein PHMEG_00033971 [Phytophthora megakarya]|uniref:Reverse transcriptase n=1 Tax=Phytophthora megakarya TaxID=4795 RepID=A0A225USM1_9STRA|nr:LOW QUALITY PROTEIN: hypothetical protein PHMEG_00033971 [Phytophthora megakarya]
MGAFDTRVRGVGGNVYTTEGRTRIKITFVGYLVYFVHIWIGDLPGQNVILDMEFMILAGVWMDLADDRCASLTRLGSRLYRENVRSVTLERNLRIPVGQSEETASRITLSATEKLWVASGERWVPTVTEGPGRIRYLVISNIGEKILRLDHRLIVGMILDKDKVPQSPRLVSVGSRRYMGVMLDQCLQKLYKVPKKLVVQRSTYPIPRSILHRAEITGINQDLALILALETGSQTQTTDAVQIEVTSLSPEGGHSPTPLTILNADRSLSGDTGGGRKSESMPDQAPDRTCTKNIESKTENPNFQSEIKLASDEDDAIPTVDTRIQRTESTKLHDPSAEEAEPPPTDKIQRAMIRSTTTKVAISQPEISRTISLSFPKLRSQQLRKIEDLQVGNPGSTTHEETEKFRQIIWKKRHILIDMGNTLSPAVRGVFREKVADLIKELLAAEIIRPSTSRLSRLMIYPMPQINNPLEGLDKAWWYCPLDMASGFWVVPMTD